MQLTNSSLLQKEIFINNEWICREGQQRFTVYNPADGSKIIDVADATVKDTEQAIAAATAAFKNWSKGNFGKS